jgi:FG-GAP repeat/FG-GAP-like repeat
MNPSSRALPTLLLPCLLTLLAACLTDKSNNNDDDTGGNTTEDGGTGSYGIDSAASSGDGGSDDGGSDDGGSDDGGSDDGGSDDGGSDDGGSDDGGSDDGGSGDSGSDGGGGDSGDGGGDTGGSDTGGVDCDADGDGFLAADCGGDDCDDTDASTYPAAPDRWNRSDDDCDGDTDQAALDDVATAWTAGLDSEGRITALDNLLAADFSGDGTADIAVGAAFEASDAGRVYVLDGTAVGAWTGDITSDALWSLEGARAIDNLGYLSNAAGDLDGDGVVDLVVGARYAEDGGRAYWFDSSSRSGLVDLGDATGTVLGDQDGTAGWGFDGAGDIDGDGQADLAVGDGSASSPSVGIWSGGPSGTAVLLDADAVLTGTAGEAMGETVVSGDVDGDGYDDLLLGAPYAGGTNGAVLVVLGATSLPTGSVSPWLTISGGAGGYLGTSSRAIARPADLDGSGAADVSVADYRGAGAAYIFLDPASGTVATTDAEVSLTRTGSGMGSTLVTGDADGDGWADLIAGAYYDDSDAVDGGAVYTIWGGGLVAGTAYERATADAILDAGSGDRYVGTAVALPGDLDGDGRPDLLVGASWDSTAEYRGGRLLFVPGG